MDKWDPEDYYKHSYPQYTFALGLVRRLGLLGNERILDIGCGDGKITAKIAACVSNGSGLGIDSSADMIAFAKNMSRRQNILTSRFAVETLRSSILVRNSTL